METELDRAKSEYNLAYAQMGAAKSPADRYLANIRLSEAGTELLRTAKEQFGE